MRGRSPHAVFPSAPSGPGVDDEGLSTPGDAGSEPSEELSNGQLPNNEIANRSFGNADAMQSGNGPQIGKFAEAHGAIDEDTATPACIPSSLSISDVLTDVRRVREGHELQHQGCVLDVIQMVLGCERADARVAWCRLKGDPTASPKGKTSGHINENVTCIPESKQPPKANASNETCNESSAPPPEGVTECNDFIGRLRALKTYKFDGQGQHDLHVAPLHLLTEIAMAVPGNRAAEFRRNFCFILHRVWAGDVNLENDIRANRASVSANDRAALLQGVPGAAPVVNDGGAPAEALAAPLLSRITAKMRRAHLRAVPGIKKTFIPMQILKSPGGYVGVLGLERVDGIDYVVVKLGESALIWKRWTDHAASAPFWQGMWAATVNSVYATHEDIQTVLKIEMARQMALRGDIKVTDRNTQNEEFWVPMDSYVNVIDEVTRGTEEAMGAEIVTPKQIADDDAPRNDPTPVVDRCFKAAFASNVTGFGISCGPDVQLPDALAIAQEQTKCVTVREREATKRTMIENGYSIADIERIQHM